LAWKRYWSVCPPAVAGNEVENESPPAGNIVTAVQPVSGSTRHETVVPVGSTWVGMPPGSTFTCSLTRRGLADDSMSPSGTWSNRSVPARESSVASTARRPPVYDCTVSGNAARMPSTFERSPAEAFEPRGTTSANATRSACGEWAASGTRGPFAVTTSPIAYSS